MGFSWDGRGRCRRNNASLAQLPNRSGLWVNSISDYWNFVELMAGWLRATRFRANIDT